MGRRIKSVIVGDNCDGMKTEVLYSFAYDGLPSIYMPTVSVHS